MSGAFRPGPAPSERPTPREIKALVAVADGATLTGAARDLGWPVTLLAHVLSCAYRRLGVKDLPVHRLSHERRQAAIAICKARGWWPESDDPPGKSG